jgi:anti-anti-sigma factor
MEITPQKIGDILVIRLAGRLDASWCDTVEKALTAAVRQGEHRIHLDMEKVDYISSAGLRVLFSVYKQLIAIKGVFAIRNPSPNVRSVLQMVGIGSLIATGETAPAAQAEACRSHSSAQADYEIFTTPEGAFHLDGIGDGTVLQGAGLGRAETIRFDESVFALGIGALGTDASENQTRFGEFLAVGGAAAYQPADGSTRPDFLLHEGEFVPEGQLLLGLRGRGNFPILARFAVKKDCRTVGLSELAATALELAETPAVALVAVTETSGLVGASLRQSVAAPAASDRFAFPQIRDWLSFTAERSFRDSTSLICGVAARDGTPYQNLLRPHGGVRGHFHAASFPYRPLQKGRIEMIPTVTGLFDTHSLQAVLHLLADSREFNGVGESEFLRGALWIAPIPSAIPNPQSAIA